MKLFIKKLCNDAILPQYAHPEDAGMDLYSIEPQTILPGETALVRTGIAIALPPNTEAQVRPRSGLAAKNSVTVLNTPGTVDEGYRGEIKVIMINHGKQPFVIEPKMRIAQMVICPVLHPDVILVDELDATARGAGGFGSTGVK
jgi:dUTP pyrophosphatase